MAKTKTEILKDFSLFSVPAGGIGSWLTEDTHEDVFCRLGEITPEKPLPFVQLNQLLVLGHEAPVSEGFFRYYWLEAPTDHQYEVNGVPGFDPTWLGRNAIVSLEQLKCGLYRLYIDALLNFGNVRTAFRQLRDCTHQELVDFFGAKRFDTRAMKQRGPTLPLKDIAKDSRYLISEMACKSYGDSPETQSDLRQALLQGFEAHVAAGNPSPTIRQLLEGERVSRAYQDRQQEFIFSADEVLDEIVTSLDELRSKFEAIAEKFVQARQRAPRQHSLLPVNGWRSRCVCRNQHADPAGLPQHGRCVRPDIL